MVMQWVWCIRKEAKSFAEKNWSSMYLVSFGRGRKMRKYHWVASVSWVSERRGTRPQSERTQNQAAGQKEMIATAICSFVDIMWSFKFHYFSEYIPECWGIPGGWQESCTNSKAFRIVSTQWKPWLLYNVALWKSSLSRLTFSSYELWAVSNLFTAPRFDISSLFWC